MPLGEQNAYVCRKAYLENEIFVRKTFWLHQGFNLKTFVRLLKVAFEGMAPFPRRQELITRQSCYLSLLKDRLRKKEELKAAFVMENTDVMQAY